MTALRTMFLMISISLFTMGCSASVLGPVHDWVNWDEIEGPFRPEVVQPTDAHDAVEKLRVVTFNVHYGENVEDITQAFKENSNLAHAEVLLLQEIQSYPGEPGSRASRLAAALEMGYVYAPARQFGNGTHGLAILSHYAFENVRVMELPYADLVTDSERRIALSADVQVGNTLFRVINVHLDTRINVADRILQLRPAILDAPLRALVGGDFNSNPFVWAYNLIPLVAIKAAGVSDQSPILDDYMRTLGFQTTTATFGATVDFPLIQPRLDSIFSRGLTDLRGAVERTVSVSDHWPVWLEVGLPAQ